MTSSVINKSPDSRFINISNYLINVDDISAVIIEVVTNKFLIYNKCLKDPIDIEYDIHKISDINKYLDINKQSCVEADKKYNVSRYFDRPKLTLYMKMLLKKCGFLEIDDYCYVRPECIGFSQSIDSLYGEASNVYLKIAEGNIISYHTHDQFFKKKLNIIKKP